MGVFFSFFRSPTPSLDLADAKAGGESVDVPDWCLNTSDYLLQREGVVWTPQICERSMQEDVDNIMKNYDSYIQEMTPDDEALVLSNYDNKSKVPKQGSDGDFVDDARWTVELTKRVTQRLKEEKRNISADEKVLLGHRILRVSKLSRRSFYDYRGRANDPNYGNIDTVFSFSGQA